MSTPSPDQFDAIRGGYDPDPARSHSLRAEAYTDSAWFAVDQKEILSKSWQWVCHSEKVRAPGSYVTTTIADQPIVVISDQSGVLRAFYNVCKHRAHPVLSGEGKIQRIVCPYHAWRYRLDGQLAGAPQTGDLKDFSPNEIRLSPVHVEEFCGFIFVCWRDAICPVINGQQC